MLTLAEKGQAIEKPIDIIKEPYVLEFLGLPGNKICSESDLEKRLIDRLEDFLLELGRGFMFVGTQQRITINNTHYYEPDDNPPIGIILCADKDEIVAEYALGGLENNIFASKYTYYIPNKEQLIMQVEAVLEQNLQETGNI